MGGSGTAATGIYESSIMNHESGGRAEQGSSFKSESINRKS
jgi:hypothetical protein